MFRVNCINRSFPSAMRTMQTSYSPTRAVYSIANAVASENVGIIDFFHFGIASAKLHLLCGAGFKKAEYSCSLTVKDKQNLQH